jgi:hypothetical protein
MKETFTKVHETETSVEFMRSFVTKAGEEVGYKLTFYKSREAAGKAGKKAREVWGSNLVYLGSSPVEVNGETYYENGFNVWD